MSDPVTQVMDDSEVYRRSGLLNNGDVAHHIYVDQHGNTYFSATTILDLWTNEEKKRKLENWKEENDGSGDTEHHEKILRYTQLRGTYLHAKAQEKYADEEVWGEEEEHTVEELKSFGEYHGIDAYERVKEEEEYFVEEIHNMLDPRIDEVLFVEDYVFNSNPQYAGQSDLVYRNNDGEVVICDLKTSKVISYTYLLQTNAYAKVIENELGEPVDKLQICRAHPDEEDSEVYTVDRNEMAITVDKVIEDEYGHKLCIDAPYEAKDAIKNLDWELFHQSWNEEHEMWTITVENKDGIITPDLALNMIADEGWTVECPEHIQKEILSLNYVSEDDLNFDRTHDSNPHETYGDQLFDQFSGLAQEYEDNRPITFPEDVLDNYTDTFSKDVIEDSKEFITNNAGSLGDHHPHDICAAVLHIHNAEIHKIYDVFDPETDTLKKLTDLYSSF